MTDNTGAVLPGVTVTVSSPALIQAQVQVTSADGGFRFLALPPGVYEVGFDLAGFQGVKREGIRIVIGQTLTVDQQLQVATLQETVTVTGASPVVDTSTTTMGTNFTKELLTEIPNARDIWAAMSQAPGIQMQGFDVGGSHAGTSTGYVTYGLDVQNQTKIEGVDTTEGTSANAGYFDFGSFEEFQLGGAGSDAGSFAPGASIAISVKSGGDKFTGNWYSDWQGDATISDNVPDNLKSANTKDSNGFFIRTPLTRGNPISKQYDINFNVGGPLWKKKAWWFYSYRLDDQYKFIIGSDALSRSKLTNDYTLKGTFQLNQSNQIIGFYNKRNKLQDRRDFGPTTPLSAARYQASTNYPGKIEWTSVLNNKMFLDVLYGYWGNFFPLRPTAEVGIYEGPIGPGRQDLANSQFFDGGGNSAYQNQRRFKPQFYASLSYFKEGWHGSHDFKFGYDNKLDRRNFIQDQPFDIFYRDQAGAVNQVDIYNTPVSPYNDVKYQSGWFSDTWKFNERMTVNYGGRLEHYTDGWPDQTVAPNGVPALAGWNDPVYQAFIKPQTVSAKVVSRSTNFSPRVGMAYDLTGDNRTVLKAFFGQFRFNSADTIADQQNPVGKAQLRYRFNDLNGNRLLDGPQELNGLVQTVGGAGFVTVDPNLIRPSSTEFSTSVEREIRQGLSGRVSYVYKNIRNEWNEVDTARLPLYTVAFPFNDIGNDGVAGTSDDKTVQLLDRPATAPSNRMFTNPSNGYSNFNTVEVALNRRFSGKWLLLTSFGYTWLDQINGMTSSTSTTGVAGNLRSYFYRPSQLMFGDNGYESTTTFNYKVIGRYVMPYDIGLSGSWKFQSGYQWGRVTSVNFPGDGAQNIRMEPVTSNRAPNVGIADFRLDKSFRFGKIGKLTAQMDIFNLMNAGTVTTFRSTTGATFKEVISILDPRIIRFGVRYDF
ncbi:MAG: carboxypeptidase regulatory-like domain-containing protein [Vicinamibacterales bacterium]